MAKGRYINTHFWDDSYIIDLDPIEKLLFLYLLTNPCTDIAGAYEISLRRMAFDTGIDKDMLVKVLERFEKANKIIYRDGWILIVNWLKNQSMNPSVKAGAVRSVENCPDWIKHKILNGLDSVGTACGQDALPNLTKPNSTLPQADKVGGKPPSLPKKIEDEINSWLDAVAPLVGAKSRSTIADAKGWRDAVSVAVSEGRDLSAFLATVKSERERNKASPQYFTPKKVLAVVQANGNGSKSKFQHSI